MVHMTSPPSDARRYAPSAARNRDPIREILIPKLPQQGLVLEIASGSGEHTAHLASASSVTLTFQPSDPEAENRASIDAWRAVCGLANIRPAVALDAASAIWPIVRADVIVCINMIHIAPWQAAEGLIRGAARTLNQGGYLYLYGPYRRDGQHTSPGNAAFDESLRAENSQWGIRDLEAVIALTTAAGLSAPEIISMPANNLSLFFHRLT